MAVRANESGVDEYIVTVQSAQNPDSVNLNYDTTYNRISLIVLTCIVKVFNHTA